MGTCHSKKWNQGTETNRDKVLTEGALWHCRYNRLMREG